MAKSAYVREIERAIGDIYCMVEGYGDCFSHELHARYWLIDPMLKALGWDVGNPGQVQVEYWVGNGKRVDYVCFKPGSETPLMIVEAKSTGNPDYILEDSSLEWDSQKWPESWYDWPKENVEELEGYTENMKEGYGILTDGVFWSIYDLSRPGQFADKLEAYFCILIPPIEQSVEVLKKFHRHNLR